MKSLKILKWVFALLGLAMLIGAFFLFSNTIIFLSNAISTEGTVIELVRSRSSSSNYTYAPVVKFSAAEAGLIEFKSTSSSNPPSYSVGETVEVLYEASSPQRARIDGFFSLWGGATIVGLMGAILFSTGASMIIFRRLKDKKIKALKKNGVPITARLEGINRNRSLEVNGRNPYQITAQWLNPDSNELHIFKSENIWFDPTCHVKTDTLTVLIEKDNPQKYYVDTSFLPSTA